MNPHILVNLTVVFACLVLAGSTTARADVVTFKDGSPAPFGVGAYAGTEDTMLNTNNGQFADQNFGARANMEVGESTFGSGFVRRSLIRFDVTAMTGQFSTIDSVTLRLFVTNSDALGGSDIQGAGGVEVHRLADANAGWVEGTESFVSGGDPPDNDMSTWLARLEGVAGWAGSQGAGSPGTDFVNSLLASQPYDSADEATLEGQAFDLVLNNTSFFADWVNGNNAGLRLSSNPELNSGISFFQRNAGNVAVRPELIVEFTAIPEPSMFVVWVVGSIGIVVVTQRRRRTFRIIR